MQGTNMLYINYKDGTYQVQIAQRGHVMVCVDDVAAATW